MPRTGTCETHTRHGKEVPATPTRTNPFRELDWFTQQVFGTTARPARHRSPSGHAPGRRTARLANGGKTRPYPETHRLARENRCPLRAGATLAGTAAELGRSLESRHEITVTALLDADRVDIARRILGSRLRSVVPGPAARDNTTGFDTTGSDTAASSDEGGRATVTIAFEHLNGVRQLLQFSDRIEVTSPPEARQLIRRLAEQLAHKHR